MIILLTAFVIAVVSAVLINKLFPKPVILVNPKYSEPSCKFYWLYLIKVAGFSILLWLRQLSKRKERGTICANNVHQLMKPTDVDTGREAAQNLQLLGSPELANDAVAFQGSDSEGNQLLVRLGRRGTGEAQVWLLLRLRDAATGDIGLYVHPEHPSTTQWSSTLNGWEAGGLTCEVREPMRRWRVSYNGWLKKLTSNSLNAFENDSGDDLVQAKFSFFWQALADHFDFNWQLSPLLTARSICKEHWDSGFFARLQKSHEDRYEQWGQLLGQVEVGGAKPIELRLKGMRDHCYGPRDWSHYDRYTANMGYCDDGTFFHVGAVCIPDSTTNFLYGYVGDPYGQLTAIDSSSLNLSLLGDYNTPPDKFSISFTAGGRNFLLQAQTHTRVQVFNGQNCESLSNLRFITVNVNGSPGQGFSEFEYRNRTGRPSALKMIPRPTMLHDIVPALHVLELLKHQVLPLSHYLCRCEELVGGKARQLSYLMQIENEFKVPGGIVVTVNAFRQHIDSDAKIKGECSLLESMPSDDLSKLVAHCEKIKSMVISSTLDASLLLLIKTELCRVFDDKIDNLDFAVRSSAIGEDGSLSSAAGQMETILGVKSDQLAIALLKCWASHFNSQAVQYRRQCGQNVLTGCAVVVQKLVPAQSAGVLFTCDPVTSNLGKVVINSTFGLGEGVVSGEVNPDQIEIDRNYLNQMRVSNIIIGDKPVESKLEKDILDAAAGDIEKPNVCSLSEKCALRLAQIAVEIEQIFARPIDVEWAVVDDEIYLLQVRLITNMNMESTFELMHEFDTPLRSETDISTRGNVGEVLAGVFRPLSCSLITQILDKAIQLQTVNLFKVRKEMIRDSQVVFSTFGGRVLFNLSQTMYINPLIKNDRNVPELCIIGRTVDLPCIEPVLERQSKLFSPLAKLRIMFGSFSHLPGTPKVLENAQAKYAGFQLPPHDGSPLDILKAIDVIMVSLCDVWFVHVRVSGYSSTLYSIICGILKSKGGFSTQVLNDVAKLYSSCNQVTSADVPSDLEKFASSFSAQNREAFLSYDSDQESLNWLVSDKSGPAGDSLRTFLQHHGHRCLNEIDIYDKTWGDDPLPLMPTLRNLLRLTNGDKMSKRVVSVEEAVDSISTPLNVVSKRILRFLVSKARNGVGYREQAKSLAVRMGNSLRQGVRQLGAALAKQGSLPDSDLVYYLNYFELYQLVQNKFCPEFIGRAQRRRRVVPKQAELEFDDIMVGVPVPLDSTAEIKTLQNSELKATPVSAGKVVANVCVAVTIKDAENIKKGDILITHSTDIAWSIYFPLLSGVVTELGGLLSHGAVVAREYGLPCLVSASGATKLFKSGDRVMLDGNKGILAKVD